MNERDYLKLKRQFEDDYRQKLAALELIWQEFSGGKKPPKEPHDTNSNNVERGNSAAAVEDFVKQWDGEPFSAKQVEAWITQVKGLTANRTTIIHKLRRMVNDGELNLVTKGSGKRASLYATPASIGLPPHVELVIPPVEMASEHEVEELKQLLIAGHFDKDAFRLQVMIEEFGVTRLRELTHDQIQDLIGRYQPQPVGAPPPDDIPF